jgi:peptidoglycan/LPS O-acetylase OafA/YrhL
MTVHPATESTGQVSPTGRATIPALTGIRALAAGWVVLGHFKDPIFDLLPGLSFLTPIAWSGGGLGVEVFFILSGFIIAYNYAEKLQLKGSYRGFLRARAARIYPIHLATLTAMAALIIGAAVAKVPLTTQARNTPGNFIGNFSMLQAIPGFQAINVPSWSVSCEAAAYLAFPVLGAWALRTSGRRALGWAALILVSGVSILQLFALFDSFSAMTYPIMWVRIACEFPAGVLLWAWWRQIDRRDSRWWDLAALAGAAVTILACYLVEPDSPAVFLPTPAIALFVVASASASGPVFRFLTTRPMQWFGRISYSLYMTHFIVFIVVNKIIAWERFVGAPLLARLGVLTAWALLVVASASAAFYLVEEPGRKLMRRGPSAPRRDTRARVRATSGHDAE